MLSPQWLPGLALGELTESKKERDGTLTYDTAVSALQRGRGAGDGPIGAVLGGDAGADGRQGGAGAAGGRRGRAAGQRGAGAYALRSCGGLEKSKFRLPHSTGNAGNIQQVAFSNSLTARFIKMLSSLLTWNWKLRNKLAR